MRTQAPGEGEEQAYANYDPLSGGGTSKQWAESAAFHSLGDGSSVTVQTARQWRAEEGRRLSG